MKEDKEHEAFKDIRRVAGNVVLLTKRRMDRAINFHNFHKQRIIKLISKLIPQRSKLLAIGAPREHDQGTR